MIRQGGYDCPLMVMSAPLGFSDGYDVWCPGGRPGIYEFQIENHGGL